MDTAHIQISLRVKMERFELKDIVTQDKNGIVYVAQDSVLGRKVSIRRFFPFGQNEGGLDKEEAIAFEIAAKRLSKLEHVSLRSIIIGGIDPIDAIPYLVTEWVDGISLKTILADETMEPALVIDVLRIALETSIILSHVLGEEAVWVETEIESIVVGTQESGRGFTFWISPFKWLGADIQSRKLSSIVELGEELTGWEKKIVSDQAGYGLGGWLKWLRNNPDASLHEALESLSASTGNEPPAAEEALVQQARHPAVPKLKKASSKTPLLATAGVALLVIGAALFYLHKTAKAPEIAAQYTEQEISEVIVDTAPGRTSATQVDEPKNTSESSPTAAPKPKDDATTRVNALAEKLRKDADERGKKETEELSKQNERVEAQKKIFDERGGFITPDQIELVRTFKSGDQAILKGTILSVRTSGSGKTIYLNFSDPYDRSLTNALLHQRDYKGEYELDKFKKLIGKAVTVNGNIFIESPNRSHYVKVTSIDQVTIGE